MNIGKSAKVDLAEKHAVGSRPLFPTLKWQRAWWSVSPSRRGNHAADQTRTKKLDLDVWLLCVSAHCAQLDARDDVWCQFGDARAAQMPKGSPEFTLK